MLRSLTPLLVLVACANPSQGLAIERVVPDTADPQMPRDVTIEGTFSALTSSLDRGDTTIASVTASVGGMPLPATWMSQDQISAMMPGLDTGSYDVTVTLDGRTATLKDGYLVGMPAAGTDGGTPSGPHQITVTGTVTGGPLVDFPLLVDLQDSRLRTIANGGEVASDQGFDIFFSLDQAGTMVLSHELERYSAGGGELVAWVKIPSLDTGTTLFIHLGSPTSTSREDVPGVWSNGFAAVYHLRDASDSTAAGNAGTDAGTTDDPAGQIEIARSFNGITSRITIAPSVSIDNIFGGAGGTVAAWVFVRSAGQAGLGRVFEKSTVVRMGNCDGGGGGVNSLFFTHEFTGGPATWCTQPTSVPPNAWTHVALAYNKASTANQPTIYINGTAQPITQIQQTNGNSFSDASGPLVLGNNSAAARAFDGSVDELSYAHGIRDPGWIRTSFDNQNAPNNFVTLGP